MVIDNFKLNGNSGMLLFCFCIRSLVTNLETGVTQEFDFAGSKNR